jgi:hypothetical protein
MYCIMLDVLHKEVFFILKLNAVQINLNFNFCIHVNKNLSITPLLTLERKYLKYYFFQHRLLMKMILSSVNLVRKVGVCITSEENGESKLTSEENLFNNLLH